MLFDREILKDWVATQLASPVAARRCIGRNFLIEENVSDERRLELETHKSEWLGGEDFFASYYLRNVQGEMRGHVPSTFVMPINYPALQQVAVHPSCKLIRLERLDAHLLPVTGGFDFNGLNLALKGGDLGPIFDLLERFYDLPGERPVFTGYKSDIRRILKKKDWLPRIIDSFGLYHHYPYDPGKPNSFALFEYTAAEVIEQASRKGIRHPFALPTVLEAWNSPAFCPVPRSTGQGHVVNLRGKLLARPAREILHVRFDYSTRHLIRVGAWRGAENPDIEAAYRRHMILLREETGRLNYGKIGKMP